MDNEQERARAAPTLKTVILAVLAAFLLGGLIVGWIAWRTDFGDGAAGIVPLLNEEEEAEPSSQDTFAEPSNGVLPTAAETPEAVSSQAAEAVERVEEQQGGLDQRLAAAEQRLARLDLQAQAAAGNAARAEGLLIAFATRRAMERGAELGYLADQLRLRFGDAMPNAVRTIIANSRRPVTLDRLLVRLEGLAPQISSPMEEQGIERLRRELSELFVIRRESAPSPQPGRRLDRARLFLESGRIDAAIQEVENLPGAERAERWIADARRYSETQRALDLIETAAVLEPRRLRDGVGNRVDQLSPATQAATGAASAGAAHDAARQQ